MTKDVIAMAREAGLNDFGVAWQLEALERFATLVRNAALEEAAQRLEQVTDTRPQSELGLAGIHAAAILVRKMKEPTT